MSQIAPKKVFFPSALRNKPLAFGILLIFSFSLFLRFWQLNRFNTLIFDEIYFADHGFSYLKQLDLFDVHPPLGKYLLALGIWLHAHLFGGAKTFAEATAVSQIDAIAYRWLNAVTGSLIPLLVGAIAYQFTRRDRLTLLASGFVALDGLLLVESRLSLINVYLIFFGLIGLWCFGKAIADNMSLKWLMLAGGFWGACASIKWNGLGFLLGVYLLYGLAWGLNEIQHWQTSNLNESARKTPIQNPLKSIFQIPILQFVLSFGVVPFIIYRLQWIPHLQLQTNFTFLGMQRQILGYHESIGSSVEDHPYCSPWYSWIWMRRPVAYYFERLELQGNTTIFDIHAFGNPILWWLSTLAIAGLIFKWCLTIGNYLTNKRVCGKSFYLQSIIITQYCANFLPWASVSRCTYIYHYMPASILAFMTLAGWVDSGLGKRHWLWRSLSVGAIAVIIAGFIFWLPIYLGLPLSPEEFNRRMWFQSWY